MRECPSCAAAILEQGWRCQSCGWEPEDQAGVVYLAPDLDGNTEGYDPSWYAELAAREAGNFWFVARSRLIHWLMSRHAPRRGAYMEIGCGTGFVLKMLHQAFPCWDIRATEAHSRGIAFAQKRVSEKVRFFQMDACAIPFREELDVIGAYDVIKHISDDTRAISQIHSALKGDGIFVLSVPQHMFLWSRYDEAGGHFRRYSAAEIEHKLRDAGFSIVTSTSFNSLLLPLMLVSRLLRDKSAGPVEVLSELGISPILNEVLSVVLRFEYALILLGVRFPVGGSRMIVAQKIARDEQGRTGEVSPAR